MRLLRQRSGGPESYFRPIVINSCTTVQMKNADKYVYDSLLSYCFEWQEFFLNFRPPIRVSGLYDNF